MRWVLVFLVGVATGFVAWGVHLGIAVIYNWKWHVVLTYLQNHPTQTQNAFGLFVAFNVVLVLISGILVYIEPACAGSGIPEVKGYPILREPPMLEARSGLASDRSQGKGHAEGIVPLHRLVLWSYPWGFAWLLAIATGLWQDVLSKLVVPLVFVGIFLKR